MYFVSEAKYIFNYLWCILTLSQNTSFSNKNAGKTVITTIILIIAPLDINVHKEPIISIFEYAPTPNVAPKKHKPLTIIDPIELASA